MIVRSGGRSARARVCEGVGSLQKQLLIGRMNPGPTELLGPLRLSSLLLTWPRASLAPITRLKLKVTGHTFHCQQVTCSCRLSLNLHYGKSMKELRAPQTQARSSSSLRSSRSNPPFSPNFKY